MDGQGLTSKDRFDKIFSAERGGRTESVLKEELVAFMNHKHPLCLYGEGSNLARLDQGFATMCKTYEDWIWPTLMYPIV